MTSADMLVIEGLNKQFQRPGKPPVQAVKDFAIAIGKGEIVALLGSSGCGKTSTLRMIAGLESVTSGAITLAGRRIEQLAPSQRNVAMAFEGYSLPVDIVAETPFNEKTVYLTRTAEGAEILAALPAAAAGTLPHGRAFLSFPPEVALLFDRATRARIERQPMGARQ